LGVNINEKDIAGASYILTFYKEVQDLTSHYANYINIMLELQNKYDSNVNKMSDEEKALISQQAQLVRYAAHKCYIEYNSIMLGIKQQPDVKLTESYNKIKTNFIINRDDLETYVILLNAVIVKDVIQNLLATSQDFINKVFGNQSG